MLSILSYLNIRLLTFGAIGGKRLLEDSITPLHFCSGFRFMCKFAMSPPIVPKSFNVQKKYTCSHSAAFTLEVVQLYIKGVSTVCLDVGLAQWTKSQAGLVDCLEP